jgi:hypothetical protein
LRGSRPSRRSEFSEKFSLSLLFTTMIYKEIRTIPPGALTAWIDSPDPAPSNPCSPAPPTTWARRHPPRGRPCHGRPQTAPADGGVMGWIQAGFQVAATNELRTVIAREQARRDDRSHAGCGCADAADWRGRRTDPFRKVRRWPKGLNEPPWPSKGNATPGEGMPGTPIFPATAAT